MIYVSSIATGEKTIEGIASWGAQFDNISVELSGNCGSDAQIQNKLQGLQADRIGFIFHNYFPPPKTPFVLNLASQDEQICNKTVEHCKNAINISGYFGLPYYSIHAGFLFDPNPKELGQKLSHSGLFPEAEAIDTFIKNVVMLSEFAKTRGVRLLIENNVLANFNLANFGKNPLLMVDPVQTRYILQASRGAIGLLLDVAHLKVSAKTLGFDPANFIRDCDPWISAYHLSDNDGLTDSNDLVRPDSWFWPYLKPNLNYYSLELSYHSVPVIKKQIEILKNKICIC